MSTTTIAPAVTMRVSTRKRNDVTFVAFRASVFQAAILDWQNIIDDADPKSFTTYEVTRIFCHNGYNSDRRHVLWVREEKVSAANLAMAIALGDISPPLSEPLPPIIQQTHIHQPLIDTGIDYEAELYQRYWQLGQAVDHLIDTYLSVNNVTDDVPLWDRPRVRKPLPESNIGVRGVMRIDLTYIVYWYDVQNRLRHTKIDILKHGGKGALAIAQSIRDSHDGRPQKRMASNSRQWR